MKKSSGMNDYRWLLTCAAGGMLAAATPADAQTIKPGLLPPGQKNTTARTAPPVKGEDGKLKLQAAVIQQPSQAAKIIPVGNNSIQEELEKLYRESGREMPAMTLESAAQQTSPNYQRPANLPGTTATTAPSQAVPSTPANNWYAPGTTPAALPPAGGTAAPATKTPQVQPGPAPTGNAVSRFFKRLTPGRKETAPANSQPPVPPGTAQAYPPYQAPSVPPAELTSVDEMPPPSAPPGRLPAVNVSPQVQAVPASPTSRPMVTIQGPLPAPQNPSLGQVPAQVPPRVQPNVRPVNPGPGQVMNQTAAAPAPAAASSILAVPPGLSQTVTPPAVAPVDMYAIPPSPSPRPAEVVTTLRGPVSSVPPAPVAKIPVTPAIPASPAEPAAVQGAPVTSNPVAAAQVPPSPATSTPVATVPPKTPVAETVFEMPVPLGTLPAPVENVVQNSGRIPATPSAAQSVPQPVVTETRIPVNQVATPSVTSVAPAVETAPQAATPQPPAVAGGLDDFPDPFTEVSEAMADGGLRKSEHPAQTPVAVSSVATSPTSGNAGAAIPSKVQPVVVPQTGNTPGSQTAAGSVVTTVPDEKPKADEVVDPFSGVALPPLSLPPASTGAPAAAPSMKETSPAVNRVTPNKPGEPALEDWELEDLAEEAAEQQEEARLAIEAAKAAKSSAMATEAVAPANQQATPAPAQPVVPPSGQAPELPVDAVKTAPLTVPAAAPVLLVPAEAPALTIPPTTETTPPVAAPAAPAATPPAKDVLPGTLATSTPAPPGQTAVAPAQLPADVKNDPRMKQIFAREGVSGLKGFCPVALRDQRELKDTQPQFAATYRGQKFQFSTAEAKARFEQEPTRYAPAAYGADVVVLANAKDVVEGSLDHAAWYKGKLYLFSDAESHRQFVIDPAKYASPAGLE